jgi:hypothetical protein
LHPYEDLSRIVEFFKWQVEFAKGGMDAGEFDIFDAQALETDAFFWNAL